MKKFFLHILLATFLMALTISSSALREGDYDYDVENGKASILAYNGSSSAVVTPTTLGGYPVTKIESEAFAKCTTLKSITISYGIESIGSYAFRDCKNLTSVSLPETLTEILTLAFLRCTNLSDINFPESLTKIGECAFSDCDQLSTIENNIIYIGTKDNPYLILQNQDYYLENSEKFEPHVKIHEGTKYISDSAFIITAQGDMSEATSIIIPDSVKYIGDEAFYGCTMLETILFGSGVSYIGKNILKNANLKIITVSADNQYYCSVDNVLFTKDMKSLIKCATQKSGKYIIPESVTAISNYAFSGCKNVFVPDSVTTIEPYAFGSRMSSQKPTVKCYSDSAAETAAIKAKANIVYVSSHPNSIVMTIGSTYAKVFGETKRTDVPPIISNDRAMLPARFIAENLGAEVSWDAAARKATIKGNGVTIELIIDSTTAYINGNAVTLDAPAFIKDGRTYTPVRFIA